jgi:hypothetical protein
MSNGVSRGAKPLARVWGCPSHMTKGVGGKGTSRLMEKGCPEGRSPFGGSLRVSLSYKSTPFLARKGVRGMAAGNFHYPGSI